MKEKLWPLIGRITYANKMSTHTLIEDIHKKVVKDFVTGIIIQNTNDISKHAAAALWRPSPPNDTKTRDLADIQSYTNLMETLSSLLKCNTL
jgi:hypothetical protein